MSTEPESINVIIETLSGHESKARARILAFIGDWHSQRHATEDAERMAKAAAEHKAKTDSAAAESATPSP